MAYTSPLATIHQGIRRSYALWKLGENAEAVEAANAARLVMIEHGMWIGGTNPQAEIIEKLSTLIAMLQRLVDKDAEKQRQEEADAATPGDPGHVIH